MPGRLIQAAVGSAGGAGTPRTKRSGFVANAVSSTRARSAWRASARPQYTEAGVISPMPEWRCVWLYQSKNGRQKLWATAIEPNRSGKPGRYFSVLNCASEYGLSL